MQFERVRAIDGCAKRNGAIGDLNERQPSGRPQRLPCGVGPVWERERLACRCYWLRAWRRRRASSGVDGSR